MSVRKCIWSAFVAIFLLLAVGCGSDGPTLLEGTITFEPQPASVADKSMYLTIVEDPDGSAREVQQLEQVIEGEAERVRYEITGEEPPAGDYIMWVYLDMDGDGEVSAGDYVSDQVPVLMGEYPESVDVVLTPLR